MPDFDAWLEQHHDRKRYGLDESPEERAYWEDYKREAGGTPAWVLETTEKENE